MFVRPSVVIFIITSYVPVDICFWCHFHLLFLIPASCSFVSLVSVKCGAERMFSDNVVSGSVAAINYDIEPFVQEECFIPTA